LNATTHLAAETVRQILVFQQEEITAHHVYSGLAKAENLPENRSILSSIAADELKHAQVLSKYTQENVRPDAFKRFAFYWLARIFGLNFGLKLMENSEERAQVDYSSIEAQIPEARDIMKDEESHERQLIDLIREDRLNYVGSMVLGLNDALVELTGTLAGLTFAFQNTKLIALSGLITGIAASLSMAVSEYLSTRTEGGKDALTSSLYTGAAYVVTVFLLILPYLFISSYLICLAITLVVAILIILVFNFYVSVAKDYSFKTRFLEMAALSLGVALVSFIIGYLLRVLVGVDV
jgi:VIT1/CCC1 family predicted Fe2+/Mn2+ transporter